MRFAGWVAAACLLGGCSTGPHPSAPAAPAPSATGSKVPTTSPGNMVFLSGKPWLMAHPPEDGDSERPRGEEIRQHPEAEQRHAGDPNYHPPEDYHGVYAGCPTGELKAIAIRHGELLWKRYGVRDLTMRVSTHAELADPVGQELFDELMEAKHELWRRWQAGDASSKLPEFTN